MESTPASLLQRLGHRQDEEAWVRFVRLYTPFLHEWAGRLRLQPQDAADLVQEIFITLVRVLPQFNYDAHGSFRGWLYRLAVNKWKDSRKKRMAIASANGSAANEPAIEDPLIEWTEADFCKQVMRRSLDLLRAEYSPANWQAFWATVIEGRPIAEVARELGLTANAIYLTRARIVNRLREDLQGMIE